MAGWAERVCRKPQRAGSATRHERLGIARNNQSQPAFEQHASEYETWVAVCDFESGNL